MADQPSFLFAPQVKPSAPVRLATNLAPVFIGAGTGSLSGAYPDGVTSVDGVPTSAEVQVRVRAPGYAFDGALVAKATSEASGEWLIGNLAPGVTFDVVGRKDGECDVVKSSVSPLSPLKTVFPPSYVVVIGSSSTLPLAATGGEGPYSYSTVSGTYPAGVSLVGSSLVASAVSASEGEYPVLIRVTDARGATADSTVTVRVVKVKLYAKAVAVPLVVPLSSPFSGSVQATGGRPPYSFAITSGALPTGCAIDATTGAFSGTSSATAQVAEFVVTATDADGDTSSVSLVQAVSSAAAHRYWRVNITSSNSLCALTEIEMSAVAGGADMCNGGVAIASGNYGAGYEEANAFNNVLGDPPWASATSASGWIGYDFRTPVPIAEVRICARYGTYVQSPNTFTIQYSDDKVTWTTAASYSGQTSWPVAAFKTFAV